MADAPTLAELGTDLRAVPLWRRVISCLLPFAAAAAGLVLLWRGLWIPGLVAAVVLTFVTYGSVSHDLVHRTYRIPLPLNHALLSVMELTTLRSGTAYRLSHLNHHRYYPTTDQQLDPEAIAAGKGVIAGILDGPQQQLRLFRWAWRHHRAEHRLALAGEAAFIIGFWVVAILLAVGFTQFGPLVYAVLVTGGAWVIPVITVTIPHDPTGAEPLDQTRAFRGAAFDALSFGHLYHLEHHLYPSVPHQRWRELASRLDGHLATGVVEPITLSSWLAGQRGGPDRL